MAILAIPADIRSIMPHDFTGNRVLNVIGGVLEK